MHSYLTNRKNMHNEDVKERAIDPKPKSIPVRHTFFANMGMVDKRNILYTTRLVCIEQHPNSLADTMESFIMDKAGSIMEN